MSKKVNEELITYLITKSKYDKSDLFSAVVEYCKDKDIEPSSILKEFDAGIISRLKAECLESRRYIGDDKPCTNNMASLFEG